MRHFTGKAIAAGVIIVAALGALVFYFGRPAAAGDHPRGTATKLLGQYLAKQSPQAILVISNPFAELSGRPPEIYESQEAALAGLKSGLGSAAQITVFPAALRPGARENPGAIPIDPNTKTPLSFLVADDSFDQAIATHPRVEIVVSLIGLPVNLAAVQAWARPGPPQFALLLPDWRMIGDARAVAHAFESGKLVAAVVENPAPSDNERFLLVTRENVAALLEAHPEIFTP